ncbi:MAG: zinc ribbon domain-containing protein [Methanobacteriota archaeon]|nr:MAG: zinc ribbon domain-containing protein [Euryarchaeota archaeon]
MKCPNCGAENPEGQKLCGDCGGSVNTPPQPRRGLSKCPNCGFDNPEGRRFCADCGNMISRTPLVIAQSEERKKKEG